MYDGFGTNESILISAVVSTWPATTGLQLPLLQRCNEPCEADGILTMVYDSILPLAAVASNGEIAVSRAVFIIEGISILFAVGGKMIPSGADNTPVSAIRSIPPCEVAALVLVGK